MGMTLAEKIIARASGACPQRGNESASAGADDKRLDLGRRAEGRNALDADH